MALSTKYVIYFQDYLGNYQYSNLYSSDPTAGDIAAINTAIAAGTPVAIQIGGSSGPFIPVNPNNKVSSRAISVATPS